MLYVIEFNASGDMTNYNDNFNKQGSKDKMPVYDSFIDSIEEEIRKENYQKLWDKYGNLISIIVVLSLLGSMGYSFWKKRDMAEKEAISEQFTLAQNEVNSGNNKAALAHFHEMSRSRKSNYATFAKFEYASLLHDKRDKKAIDEYKSLYKNNKTPEIYRELAYIYYVNASLDLLDDENLKDQTPNFIKELSTKYVGKKWNFLALETLGYCYLKQMKYADAKNAFSELAKTENIPDAMLERTRETIQYINHQLDQNKFTQKNKIITSEQNLLSRQNIKPKNINKAGKRGN